MQPPWALDSSTVIRPLEAADASAMFRLIQENRNHLDRWLRWSGSLTSLEKVAEFIDRFQARKSAGEGYHCGIWVNERLAGGQVCWYINRHNQNCEIGYWLGAEFVGRGLATRATITAIEYLFDDEKLNRIEMQCGVQNTRSRAVAERLGFHNEGIRRESHWITSRFVDHVVYGLLVAEWKRESPEAGAD
ncbi:MAG: GNAT family protein [Gemmatimonadota bacterium]